MKQVYNPYLPLNEYIPDGEPHVFGDRVYIYGSHDREGGETFCELDYVVYSCLLYTSCIHRMKISVGKRNIVCGSQNDA